MAENVPGITVLIATYNRAGVLSQTLDALTRVDRTGIDYEIVIIDNNSNDNTLEVVREYEKQLSLSYLRETRPGKNCALNKALRECTLKDVVVFTDDDVTPAQNWFQEIVSSTKKWPGIAVFGGKIELLWPDDNQPEWAVADWIMAFGFPRHLYAEEEVFYKPPACPFGPNFWVRKIVFQKLPFFDETIGPRPRNRIMGSESSFLMDLQKRGFQILYYPRAEVRHRILREDCTVARLRRRGYTHGRGQIRIHGWHRPNIYVKSKILWCMTLAADYFYATSRLLVGALLSDPRRSCEMTVHSMVRLGQLNETANQVLKHFNTGRQSLAAERSEPVADSACHGSMPGSKKSSVGD